MIAWAELLLIPLFGLLNRLGGGLVALGSTQLARLLFRSLPTALLLFFTYHKFWLLSAMLGMGWLGWVIAQYSKYWELKTLKDWLLMALNGFLTSLLPAIPLAFIDPVSALILAPSGLLMPVAYWLGHKTPTLYNGFKNGPEMGEFYFGCFRGIALWLMIDW